MHSPKNWLDPPIFGCQHSRVHPPSHHGTAKVCWFNEKSGKTSTDVDLERAKCCMLFLDQGTRKSLSRNSPKQSLSRDYTTTVCSGIDTMDCMYTNVDEQRTVRFLENFSVWWNFFSLKLFGHFCEVCHDVRNSGKFKRLQSKTWWCIMPNIKAQICHGTDAQLFQIRQEKNYDARQTCCRSLSVQMRWSHPYHSLFGCNAPLWFLPSICARSIPCRQACFVLNFWWSDKIKACILFSVLFSKKRQ